MCRFLLFRGRDPILIADLLTRPEHSIINQSFDSKLRVDHHRPLNGDGFGVGWYDQKPLKKKPITLDSSASTFKSEKERLFSPVPKDSNEHNLLRVYTDKYGPCVFTSILPAWNNFNLIRLSEKIKSHLVFAHVRAASAGFPITETNCHPWCYGKFLWMHNGYISDFRKIKRKLQQILRDELYHFVQGNTDSEWVFALFLNQLEDPLHANFTPEELKQAMLNTIKQLTAWSDETGVTTPSLMNFAVTDGKTVVCTRYINSTEYEPASLFYSSGSKFMESSLGVFKMVKCDKREDIIVVASEPLTYERSDWMAVPANSISIVTDRLNFLNYPIEDEYFTDEPRKRMGDDSVY